jgi:hypothetical protein
MTQSILTQLQALHAESEVTKAFFGILSRRKNDAKETRVNRTVQLLDAENVTATPREITRIMHRLEELGLGRYIPGRHSSPSRFEWSTSAKAAAKAATHQSSDLDLSLPPGPSISDEEEASVGTLEHRFHLRPELQVTIELPVDFTPLEAERLAAYIKTLPIAAEAVNQ